MTVPAAPSLRVILPHRAAPAGPPAVQARPPASHETPGCAPCALPVHATPAPQAGHRSINTWPEHQRPREKLLREGAAALADSELLAIVLRIGSVGRSAVDLGHALIVRFGSIQGLMRASAKQLKSVHGVGPAKLAQLQAALELARRTLSQQLHDEHAFDSPGAAHDYLRLLIGARPYEAFVCLYLDSRNRLIRIEESSRGTLTHTAVYPREIAREALAQNAAAVIVAHNHPCGDAQPSAADRHLTQRLKAALELVDVRLLDHLVISTNGVFSFAERALL